MPSIPVGLYDNSKRSVVSTITVVCAESEAKFLERELKQKRFLANMLGAGMGRNMSFKQFKQLFLRDESSEDDDFTISS